MPPYDDISLKRQFSLINLLIIIFILFSREAILLREYCVVDYYVISFYLFTYVPGIKTVSSRVSSK